MKKFRILLVMVIIFSTVVTTVGAAPAKPVGFISLLSRVDPSIPFEIQTRDALRRIMPQVLAAQKSGEIEYFEPSMSTGMLKVVFNDGVHSTFAGLPVYNEMKSAAVVSNEKYLTRGVVASNQFFIELYDSCFYSSTLPVGARVVGKLFNGTQLMAVSEGFADGTGYLSDCYSWAGFYSNVLPGYKVTFKVYDGVSNALLGTYTATAPSLKITAIDKLGSVVSGTGPANKAFDLWWYHSNLDAGETYIYTSNPGTISGTGTWSKDVSDTVKIRGYDWLRLNVAHNANLTFYRSMNAPGIYCQLGNNYCDISGFASTPAAFKIVRGATTSNFTGKFNVWSYFWINWENASGVPVFLKAGDKVSGTNVASYTLPNLTAAVNFSTDVVSGKAPVNKYFDVWVLTHEPYTWYDVWAHSDALNNYSVDFTSQVDLLADKAITVEVYFRDPATGNATDYLKPFAP